MSARVAGKQGQITPPAASPEQVGEQRGDRIGTPPPGKTFLEQRGSVPVVSPQDFDTIRQQVLGGRATDRAASRKRNTPHHHTAKGDQ